MTNKQTKIRLALLEGEFPTIARRDIQKYFGSTVAQTTSRMLESAWHMYLLQGIDTNGETKGSISTKNFAQNIGNIKVTNKILKSLSKLGWITVYSKNNWSDLSINHSKLLEYCTAKELLKIRSFNKFNKYMLTNKPATKDNLVRINGKTVTTTEAKRTGFMKAGNTEFQFDTQAMWKNIEVIRAEVNKGMDKVRLDHTDMNMDEAMYDEVSSAILDHIMYNPDNIYRPGQPVSDSRLRNIAGYTDKVFNVVASKVARACLIIPAHLRNPASQRGANNYYLMIAEVCGTFVEGTKEEKISNGREHYYQRTFHDLNYANEDDRSEAHENIWLERIYCELDIYFNIDFKSKVVMQRATNGTITLEEGREQVEANPITHQWKVPVEVDMSALTKLLAHS